MNEKSIRLLKKLIWEKYFRHNGVETKVWKNKQCISLSERLNKSGFSQSPSPRTLYNFSKTNNASAYTLSTLVHAVYNDNDEFMEYFNNEYQGNDDLKWEAFADFTNRRAEIKAVKTSTIITNNKKFALKNFNLNDPLLFIYNKTGRNIYSLFALYFLIYSILLITAAFFTGVWKGIDYPLSQSYTVWIGYVFFAAAATFFTLFNKHLSHLLYFANGNINHIKKRLSSKKVKISFLLLALFISIGLHYSFLSDNLHGWCESEVGQISLLGVYHLLLYAFNLWITFLFIFYYTYLGKIIRALAETDSENKYSSCSSIKSIIPILSNLNIFYKLIVIAYGGFAVLFFVTNILFMKTNNDFSLHTWQWIEIAILVILYVGFGFVLYWRYFAKTINNFLIAERNKLLLKNYTDQQEMVFILTLPTNPDEMNKTSSGVLNIIVWFISIILLLLISFMLYISN